MTDQTILVTGSTGFLGSHIVNQLLQQPQNYIIRLAVRTEAKGQEVLELHNNNPRLQLAIVSDMQISASFSEAVKGDTAIIHSASPFIVRSDNVERDLFEPAINITTAVLEAARHESSIKRIVLTSSFAAVVDLNRRFDEEYAYTEKDVNNFPKEEAVKNATLSYEVGKSLAEKAAWKFMENEKPGFDLVVFNPVMIYGAPLQKFSTPLGINTSNMLAYTLLLKTMPPSTLPFFVDVKDVAKLHVSALENEAASNQRYILSGGYFSWPQVIKTVRAKFPEQAARLAEAADLSPPPGSIDASKVKKDFDFEFTGWEESIVDGSVKALLEMEKDFKAEDVEKFIEFLKTMAH